jgi:ribosomal protein S18 acetylase RimI-like enzyme
MMAMMMMPACLHDLKTVAKTAIAVKSRPLEFRPIPDNAFLGSHDVKFGRRDAPTLNRKLRSALVAAVLWSQLIPPHQLESENLGRRMPDIDFTTMTDAQRAKEVVTMMRALYSEDEPAIVPDHRRFPLTIEFLLQEPSRGRIILFIQDASICGYSLLIPYWSNEFGGTLLFIDEIFVIPGSRNRGIAHSFFRFLDRERPFDAVAAALEVNPANERARRLYESLGFNHRRTMMMTYRFPSGPPGHGNRGAQPLE